MRAGSATATANCTCRLQQSIHDQHFGSDFITRCAMSIPELQREQRPAHDRHVEPRPLARWQGAAVEHRTDDDHRSLEEEVHDGPVVQPQPDHRAAGPGRLVPGDPVEEHVRNDHCCDDRGGSPIAALDPVKRESKQRQSGDRRGWSARAPHPGCRRRQRIVRRRPNRGRRLKPGGRAGRCSAARASPRARPRRDQCTSSGRCDWSGARVDRSGEEAVSRSGSLR